MDHPNEPTDNWIDVLDADDVVEGTGKDVIVGELVVAIFRAGGRLFALDGMCAHQGGPIAEGMIGPDAQGRPCVTCPWHGWQYELETGIQTVNRQPLQETYAVRETDGRIWVKREAT